MAVSVAAPPKPDGFTARTANVYVMLLVRPVTSWYLFPASSSGILGPPRCPDNVGRTGIEDIVAGVRRRHHWRRSWAQPPMQWSPSSASAIPNRSPVAGVGGGELDRASSVGPAVRGLDEYVDRTGIHAIVVVLVGPHHDGVAVHGDGPAELVGMGAV